MKIDVFKIVTVLSTIISTILAEEFSTLNNVDNGVTCAPVYSSGNGSRVFFHIENLDLEDNEKLDEIKIPFAFFRYTDIAFYYRFPDPEYYNSTYKTSLESRQKFYRVFLKFNVNNIILRNSEALKGILDEPNIRTGYLEYKKDTEKQIEREFNIAKSGIYCVLIAPPLDKGIKNLTVPVGYETSLGLPLEEYKEYYNTKLSVIIGVALSICLCFVLSFSGKKDGIPVWIVYYGLIPEVFIFLTNLIFDAIEINTKINSDTSKMFFFLHFFLNFIFCWYWIIIFYWFPLIFSMGVGIIYLIRGAGINGKLRELPTSLYKKANFLLVIEILASSAHTIYFKIQRMRGIEMEGDTLDELVNILSNNFLWPLWIALSIYYYFVTKTSIQKFPSFEELGVSVKITKSFRNSFLMMNFGVMAIFLINMIFALIKPGWVYIRSLNMLVGIIGDEKSEIISKILADESYLLKFFSFSDTEIRHYIIFLYLFVVWYDYDKALNTKRGNTEENLDSE